MISPELLQAAVVARLQANVPLINALSGGASGVREAEWHGTGFAYPHVRVERPGLTPQPNGGACLDRVADAAILININSKRDSSRTAQIIQGLVEAALRGVNLSTAALRTTALHPVALTPVGPNLSNEIVWTGQVSFRTVVTQL